VAATVASALRRLPAHSRVLLNADDPLVASLADAAPSPPLFYGIQDAAIADGSGQHASDAKDCLRCGTEFNYTARYFGHIGQYACPSCGYTRPAPQVYADRLVPRQLEGTLAHVVTPVADFSARLTVPGLYNVYNALAATAAATELGVPAEVIDAALASFRAAFGRGERVRVRDKELALFLVKNPAGFNQVIRLILQAGRPAHLLILINDNDADGRDISWLWDVDFELLRDHTARAVVSGIRAADMSLRLKYADFDMALGGTLYVLPTYTALLSLRDYLTKHGLVGAFWQER
jgi:UDP-N-acetylmuramyl tripeptide synthase